MRKFSVASICFFNSFANGKELCLDFFMRNIKFVMYLFFLDKQMKGLRAVLCTLMLCGTYLGAMYYQSQEETKDFQVTVEGVGSSKQTPDRVDIVLSLSETGATSVDARNAVAQTMKRLEATLSGQKVATNQIKTENVSVQQDWDYVSGSRVVNGYIARQTLSVFLSGADVEKDAEVLQAKLPNRVSVDSIDFSLVEKKMGSDEARNAAFEDAKKQAAQLAQLAGKKLGKVVAISASDDQGQMIYPVRAKSVNQVAESASESKLYAGEQEQTAKLTVTFELE
jgi:hypothetical protein